ncbi:hypothetical protein VB711_25925, partial [Cronbergia sp. UHCC 0137]|uniref:hypothetical protein n=1 Tax=Cronbergia sp. UHCC 0137 TaxID=3110239 RepID=UPI002B20377C
PYLHFHIDIDISQSTKLCSHLMRKNREVKKSSKKKDTIKILEYLEALGCKAIVSNSPMCKCEN